MRTIQVNSLYFGTKMGEPIACCPGARVGTVTDHPAARSSLRGSGVSNNKVKLSVVAAILDEFVSGGHAWKGVSLGDAFCIGNMDLITHYDEQTGVLRTSRTTDTYEIATVMMLCMILTSKMTDPDLYKTMRQALSEVVNEYAREGRVTKEKLALCCDIFYFGYVKRKPTLVLHDELSLAEAQAAVRARKDDTVEISLCDGLNFQLPDWVDVANAQKAPVAKPTETPEEVLQHAKDGKYLVQHTWGEDSQPYRPGLQALNGFVPNATFASLLRKIKIRTDKVLGRMNGLDLSVDSNRLVALGQDYINVTLTGKPGTGKTRIGHALAAATGMPVYVISNSHNTDEDAYEGMTKMVDGLPTAVLTDTVRCFENGGILLLEEINLPQAAVVMGALGQAVEFPFILKKDGYKPIRRHPLCIIVSTMNTGTAGSKVLSQPFANRFKQSFVLDDPEKDEFVGILQSATGCGRAACVWTYDCYSKIVRCIENDNAVADTESILLSLSMRSCIGALENMQEGMQPREAVKHSIIGKIAEQDRDVAASCLKVVDSMREPRFAVE